MRPDRAQRRTAHVVTLLDILGMVSVAAAVVMALGARKRVQLGPLLLSLRDPLRPLIVAAAAFAIRWYAGRRMPFLPSIPATPLGREIAAERLDIAESPSASRRVKYYAAGAALASLIWLVPHITNIRKLPDPYDPLLSAWRLARLAHQAVGEPMQLFDGNIYHPTSGTLTYSDATVLEGIVALPLLIAGLDPIVVCNLLLIASFPLCALAFFYAAWRLTSDAQAACVAGILGGLSAFKTLHYNHLELQFICFAPLTFLALLRLLAAPSLRTGAWFGASATAQWLACMYYGVMQFIFLAPAALFATAAWQRRPNRALLPAVATSAAIISVGFTWLAVPFMRSQAEHGGRSLTEVRLHSATPASYATPAPNLAVYGKSADLTPNFQETALFPGSLTLVLGGVGLVPPFRVATMALAAGSAVAFDGSLGTNGLFYDELFKYVPVFRGMRVPARFAAFVVTGLVLLAGYGTGRVLRLARTTQQRAILFTGIAAAALIDLRPVARLERYPPEIPPIYSAVTRDMVLAELPMEGRANLSFMYFSTYHWARLVNGASGHFPPGYAALTADMAAFPRKDLLDRLRQRGATHITVNCYFFPRAAQCSKLLDQMDGMPELQRISSARWLEAEVRLYAIH